MTTMRRASIVAGLTQSMLTTWPAFTEAICLPGDREGWLAQELLWGLVLRGDMLLRHRDETALRRNRDLMKKCRDVSMDLADATLVALAEQLDLLRMFALDRDFISVATRIAKRSVSCPGGRRFTKILLLVCFLWPRWISTHSSPHPSARACSRLRKVGRASCSPVARARPDR